MMQTRNFRRYSRRQLNLLSAWMCRSVNHELLSRSVFRPNAAAESADDRDVETFYSVDMFLPLIERVSRHLLDRFGFAQRNITALFLAI